jgi:RHS repeat-associated protein
MTRLMIKPTFAVSLLSAMLFALPTLAHAERTSSYTYNDLGLIETIDGPRVDVSDITTFDYDNSGNLTHVTNALGHTSLISQHDLSGRPLTLIDANGAMTTLTYDVRGRLLSQFSSGNLTEYTYDATGNVTTISLSNGEVISYHYDSAHRNIGYSDALGNKVTYTLDDAGNHISEDITDSSQTLTRTHSYIYDELSRLRSDIGAQGQTASFDYDVNNNLTNQVDPNTNPSNFVFDGLDRLIDTTDAAQGHTSYVYDERDNLSSVIDPNGNVTTYTYDGLDNLISQDSPDTGLSLYAYDEAGNRISQTDARGMTTHYTFDALNRLTSVSYPNPSLDISYHYDDATNSPGIGRLTSQMDASGTTQYRYDLRGNVISITTLLDVTSLTTHYQYHPAADQLIGMTYPNGRQVNYYYDLAGRLSQVDSVDNQGNSHTLLSNISYQPFGPLKDQTYGNGLSLIQASDLDYQTINITTPSLLDNSYDFDDNSNITQIVDHTANNSQDFAYDKLDRLAQANDNNVLYGDINYNYDGVHNRTDKTILINSLVDNETYQYQPGSNILATKLAGNVTHYQYDANGNMTDNGEYQFSYAENNRLTTVSQAGNLIARYTYNAQGQRSQKTTQTNTTYYVYGLQGELLAEVDETGQTSKNYVFANGTLLATTKAETFYYPAEIYYVHNDHLGTLQTLTDQNQQIVWQADYTPFGKATIVTQEVENNIRFPGQYYDAETKLHYNYFRYYDPSLGRYITSDPIGLAGGINTYNYAKQNPGSYYDPDGKNPLFVIAASYGLYKHWTRHEYNDVQSRSDLVNDGISPLPKSKSIFHQLDGATGNEKFVWGQDNQFEGVFDKNGCTVTDPLNMGTYNYFNPTGSTFEQAMHGLVDVVPYMLFGNTPYDAVTGFDDRFGVLFK